MNAARFSGAARQAVDAMFRRAAGASFRLAPDGDTVVTRADESDVHRPGDTTLIVFTMAAFTFKVTAIFHVPTAFARSSHDAARGITMLDALTEQGNLCCGAFNRELQPRHPCMGVSSPTVLKGVCASFDAEIGAKDVLRYAIASADTATVHATLYLCPYADIDLPMPVAVATEATGELELF